MKRINSGTLRMAGEKHEYFETTEIQTKIRAGFSGILSGEIETPYPFSKCLVMGPVLNESGLDDLEKQLSQVIRKINVLLGRTLTSHSMLGGIPQGLLFLKHAYF